MKASNYYKIAHEGSINVNHPAMRILIAYGKNAKNIVDLGCGEGSRLSLIVGESNKTSIGIDIDADAIKIAKKQYPKLRFLQADLTKLPLNNNKFDLVYSAYVLEHTVNPEKVIKEAVRIVRKGGFLIFIAPNYGAPNRASPPFSGSRIKKSFQGFLQDVLSIFKKEDQISWNKVKPIVNESYQIDFDTRVEPYSRSLKSFLLEQKLKIMHYDVFWEEELAHPKLHQLIFRFLGLARVFPFKYWGPQFIIVAQK